MVSQFGDPVLLQRAIEIAGAAAVQRVVNDVRRVLLFQFVETDELAEACEVRRGDVYLFESARVVRRRESRRLFRGSRIELCGASFDIARDFGQRGSAVGRREFQAVILRRIMAGGEINGAVDFAAPNLKGYGGRGRCTGAEQRMHAAIIEFSCRGTCELLGKEARVVGYKQRRTPIAAQDVVGDGGDGDAHVGEREIFGDDAAPAGGAEFYGRGRHFVLCRAVLYLGDANSTATKRTRGSKKLRGSEGD